MQIKIDDAKKIRERFGATHIVIFAIDKEGNQHIATHGETTLQSKQAAAAGNNLKKALGWPDDLTDETPLCRTHENCSFYTPDWGVYCVNGWSGDGLHGWCCLEPKKIKVVGADRACKYFEPRR